MHFIKVGARRRVTLTLQANHQADPGGMVVRTDGECGQCRTQPLYSQPVVTKLQFCNVNKTKQPQNKQKVTYLCFTDSVEHILQLINDRNYASIFAPLVLSVGLRELRGSLRAA